MLEQIEMGMSGNGGFWLDKKTLKQYQSLLKEIEQLETEKRDLYHIPAVKITDMPKAHRQKDLSDLMPKFERLQNKIGDRIDKSITLRNEIEDSISSLEPAERVLMRLRYIDGKSWEQIALEMHYSYRHTTKLHGIILAKLKKHAPQCPI